MKEGAKPRIEDDGRIYYKYNLDAVYVIEPPHEKGFCWRIIDCEYEDETEYYRIESDDEILPDKYTALQLDMMLAALPYEIVDVGVMHELPLTVDEVRAFYAEMNRERGKVNVEYNKRLKGTSYYTYMNQSATLRKAMNFAKSRGDQTRAAELEKQVNELQTQIEALLADNNVDVAILKKTCVCQKCWDEGLIGNQICECAYDQEKAIKEYNAAERRQRRG